MTKLLMSLLKLLPAEELELGRDDSVNALETGLHVWIQLHNIIINFIVHVTEVWR